jgi:hypothetical protein
MLNDNDPVRGGKQGVGRPQRTKKRYETPENEDFKVSLSGCKCKLIIKGSMIRLHLICLEDHHFSRN